MVSIYSSLLSSVRFRDSTVSHRDIITDAESDRGRLLFCPAFRRLQQKAQVFSMEPNAAVRSRLTHSLEVSQMGRYISDLIAVKLKDNKLAEENECVALVTFVETACLMHDIGNPPFGHFGEAAIANWFRARGHEVIIKACGNVKPLGAIGTEDLRVQHALADFLEFDGNPQGLRVVLKLQRNADEYGLNLTKTTVASYLKYIRTSSVSTKKDTPEPLFTKKCGFFRTERTAIKNIWKEFEYAKPQRFPLAYIMEAADDLAYCISDLEDSIEKGLLNKKLALQEIFSQWNAQIQLPPDELTMKIGLILDGAANGTYIDFRTKLNREIVCYCADQYIKEHENILKGLLPSLIASESAPGKILQLLKSYCREKVYSHETVQRVELAGYKAIYGLLDSYACLLSCDFDRFNCSLDYSKNKDSSGNPIIIEKKLLTLFPKSYIEVYRDDLAKLDMKKRDFSFREWNLRAHLIIDYISGMTDDFAMNTYRELSGMRL